MVHNEKNYVIVHADIVTGTDRGIVRDGVIRVEDGVIREVRGPAGQEPPRRGEGDIPVFDACGKYAGPGLADMHIHGCGGFDTASPDRKTCLEGMASFLAERGITTFQCAAVADMQTLCDIRSALEGSPYLAYHMCGVYTEGPFICPEKKGGLPAESIRPFTVPYMDEILSVSYEGRPLVKTMTIAPELEGAQTAFRILREAGVKTAWGHSGAYADMLTPREGAHITHLFNAMNGLDHKRPGLAVVPFLDAYRGATFELIADTVHVNPFMLEFTLNTLGTDRLCLISDAMSAGGLGPGESVYLGREVVCDGMCSRYKDTGVLIGSAMLISETARGLCGAGLAGVEDCFRIASSNPCRVLGLRDRGTIAEGMRADIVFTDSSFTVTDVFTPA